MPDQASDAAVVDYSALAVCRYCGRTFRRVGAKQARKQFCDSRCRAAHRQAAIQDTLARTCAALDDMADALEQLSAAMQGLRASLARFRAHSTRGRK